MSGWDLLLSHLESEPEHPGDILIGSCGNPEQQLIEAILANAEAQTPYEFCSDWPHRLGYRNTQTGQCIWIPFYVIAHGLKDTAYYYHFSNYHRVRSFAEDYISKGVVPRRESVWDYLWRDTNVNRE